MEKVEPQQLRQITKEDIAFLSALQAEMNTQPHLCQADPRFWVIMDYEYRKAGEDDDVSRICMISCGAAIDELDEPTLLAAAYEDAWNLGGEDYAAEWLDKYDLQRAEEDDGHYSIRWKWPTGNTEELERICEYYASSRGFTYVLKTKYPVIAANTMFLTLAEAEAHLKANYYHYDTEAHTYAMTAWRSPQVEQLYKLLHEVDFNKLLEVAVD